MHGRLIEVISKRRQFFSVCLGQRRRWTHYRILLFNLCMNKWGFVWGAGIVLYYECAVQCRASWWAVLWKMPQAGMIGCMWAGLSGYRQLLPARLALFHWFIGNCSIWWIDFQDLYVSNRLLWLQQCSKAWQKLTFTFSAPDCFLSWWIGIDCLRRLKHQLLAKLAGIAVVMRPVRFFFSMSVCHESSLGPVPLDIHNFIPSTFICSAVGLTSGWPAHPCLNASGRAYLISATNKCEIVLLHHFFGAPSVSSMA